MTEFVPGGYISIREALNRLGRELFPSDWTGEEHEARSGLIGEDEWLQIRDLPPARGGGAPISGAAREKRGDPSDPAYQAEYRANKRYAEACDRLRALLEGGNVEAAILDPWTGTLHPVSTAFWCRHDAGRMIEKGQAPIPGSPNRGTLFVKEFAEARVPTKPLPQAKIREAIDALNAKTATESLTRAQQADFVRQTFSTYRVTERQLTEIFRSVPIKTGRPRKSRKKV
jgi:hypothetical protein